VYVKGKVTSERHRVSFVGFMPAENPAFTCLVMVEEPQTPPNQDMGGLVAAPIFARICSTSCALSRPRTRAGHQADCGERWLRKFREAADSMKLEEIIKGIRTNHVAGPLDREIEALAYDSRRVGPNTLFIALKGEKVDGAQFIPKAVAAGATAVLSETDADSGDATKILVSNSREALADLAANFYRQPSSRLKVAGVTGTNGRPLRPFSSSTSAIITCGVAA
jgi:hypothetical protein